MASLTSHDDYTIAWIAPGSTEARAAVRALDKTNEDVEDPIHDGPYTYIRGELSGHKIVIVIVIATSQTISRTGNISVILDQLRSNFPSIRLAISVGAASGLPSLPHEPSEEHRDIRRGDVLVSLPSARGTIVNTYGSAHRETDLAIEKPDNEIISSLRLASMQPELTHDRAFRKGSALAECLNKFVEIDNDPLWKPPARETDVLFVDSSDGNSEPEIVPRPIRDEDQQIKVWYGRLGSGLKLPHSSHLLNELRTKFNVIGLDDCVGTFTGEIPIVLVRGVCDYGKETGTKGWRTHAIAVAAVYAKVLLSVIEPQNTLDNQEHSALESTLDQLLPYAIGTEIEKFHETDEARHTEKELDLLDQICAWAQRPSGKQILWLHDMPKMGRSAVMQTLAQRLSDQSTSGSTSLGASFVFGPDDGDQNSTRRLIPAVAHQLCQKLPPLRPQVTVVLDTIDQIFEMSLTEQFEDLLYLPLLRSSSTDKITTLAVLVEVLDESNGLKDIEVLPQLWRKMVNIHSPQLKLVVAAQKCYDIEDVFKDMFPIEYDALSSSDDPGTAISQNLGTDLTDSLTRIRLDYNAVNPQSSISPNWPSSLLFQALLELCASRFDVGARIIHVISSDHSDPQILTNTVVQNSVLGPPEAVLDFQQIRTIAGSILALAEPIAVSALATLLDCEPETIETSLKPLTAAILKIPDDDAQPIHVFRPFLLEYLLTEANPYPSMSIDIRLTHLEMLRNCLRHLSMPGILKENICGLERSDQQVRHISSAVIDTCISPATHYSCRFWALHLHRSRTWIQGAADVRAFLQQHFLHWLEVLSLTKSVREGLDSIRLLRPYFTAMDPAAREWHVRLHDAHRFMLANISTITSTPLQIYTIMVPASWAPEISKIEGYTDCVDHVAIDLDEHSIVSVSHDRKVRIWNAFTGQQIRTLGGTHPGGVTAMAISPDAQQVASISNDKTILIRSIATGQKSQLQSDYGQQINTLAFSHDGSRIAATSKDGMMQVWDTNTGRLVSQMKTATVGVENLGVKSHED